MTARIQGDLGKTHAERHAALEPRTFQHRAIIKTRKESNVSDDERFSLHGTQHTLEGLRAIVKRTGDPKLGQALKRLERAVVEFGYKLDFINYEGAKGPRVLLSVEVPDFPLEPSTEGANLEEAFRELAEDPDSVLNPWLPPITPPGPEETP